MEASGLRFVVLCLGLFCDLAFGVWNFLPVTFDPWQWALLYFAALISGFSKTGIPGISILSVSIFAVVLPARVAEGRSDQERWTWWATVHSRRGSSREKSLTNPEDL